MSGIFRYNGTNSSTPARRMTLSPFCTSPGQLQDVTMDNSYAIGYRSPCLSIPYAGNTSPGQGRSVREFEEQMATLRKENFNLKLRIYFLEEKIPGYSSANTDGHESLMKQNVDLKVDIEVLRKELQEKQSLLCDAAQAMKLMEEQQKASEDKSAGTIDELNQRIHYLEIEIKELEKLPTGQHSLEQLMGRTEFGGDINIQQKVRELEGYIKQYEQKTEELNAKNKEFENIIEEKNNSVKELESKVKKVLFQNAELQEQLDGKTKELVPLEHPKIKEELHEHKKQLADKICLLEELDSKLKDKDLKLKDKDLKLKDKTVAHETACKAIQKLLLNTKDLQDEVERLKKSNSSQSVTQYKEHQKIKEELYEYEKQLADQICLLEETNSKLKESTIVHENSCKALKKLLLNTKDLQDEVERLKKSNSAIGTDSTALGKTLSDSDSGRNRAKFHKIVEEKDAEISKLKLEVRKKTANLQNLVNKELWEKNREIERLTRLLGKTSNTPASLPCSPIHDVDQLQQSFTESEYTQALERNKHLQKKVDTLIQKLCTVTDRNTEPAVQQLKIEVQEAKDEADKSNRWRKECADVCAILTARLEELAGFLDALLAHKEVLGVLAADRRRAIRKAVDKSLDLSRSLNTLSLSVTGVSMSEHSFAHMSNLSSLLGHSLLENNESKTSNEDNGQTQIIENLKAEIKLLKKELDKKKSNDVKKERRSLPLPLENQSESEAWSEPDRNVSLARIGLEEPIVNKSVKNVKEDSANTSTESDSELNRKSKSKNSDKVSQLELMISERENQMLQAQCQLVETDNRLKKETLKLIEISKELEEYKNVNQMLEVEISAFKTEAGIQQNTFNEQEYLKRQLEDKSRVIERITEERDSLNVQVRVNEMKLETLKSDIDDLKLKHEKYLENILEKERQKIIQVEKDITSKYEDKIKEQENKHQEYLVRNWVSRAIYENTRHELEDVRKKLGESHITIEFMQENESELNAQLITNEKCMRGLKKNLDDATLQASKIVLERTKALNEKLQLESKVQELTTNLKSKEQEKLELVARINEIDNSNMLMHHKMLNRKPINVPRTKQGTVGSDGSSHQSGYTSEDLPMGPEVRAQRLDNSSPDLGIESDAGRTSSVETAVTSDNRFLRTIELSKSVKNVLEDKDDIANTEENDENNPGIDVVSSNNPSTSNKPHNCEEVDKENSELRRKLQRTKRTLEETWKRLRSANKRKEQIERDIQQQILKTHTVLNNVRTNMESELEHLRMD